MIKYKIYKIHIYAYTHLCMFMYTREIKDPCEL